MVRRMAAVIGFLLYRALSPPVLSKAGASSLLRCAASSPTLTASIHWLCRNTFNRDSIFLFQQILPVSTDERRGVPFGAAKFDDISASRYFILFPFHHIPFGFQRGKIHIMQLPSLLPGNRRILRCKQTDKRAVLPWDSKGARTVWIVCCWLWTEACKMK